MIIDEIQLRLRDKIFIFVAIAGLLLAFYFRIFDSNVSDKNNAIWSSFSEGYADEKLSDNSEIELMIGENILQAEIAKSDEKKVRGLGGREILNDNQGMLFIFSQKGKYIFEMRNMKFDLDFIFLKEDEVVGIIKKVPFGYSEDLSWDEDYDKVLEVNAGWVDKNGIMTRDKVNWRIKK